LAEGSHGTKTGGSVTRRACGTLAGRVLGVIQMRQQKGAILTMDKLLIVMLTKLPLGKEEALASLLRAFEQRDAFIPTNWGKDEKARLAYDHDEFVRAAPSFSEHTYAGIARVKKKPSYRGYFRTGKSNLNVLHVDYSVGSLREKDPAEIYSWGDLLAETLQIEFGIVHQIGDYDAITDFYGASGNIDTSYLQGFGLKAVCARTWFGPYLSNLIGNDLFRECNVPTEKTSWGGTRLDLIESPWQADDKTLLDRQSQVLSVLKKAGIFGDFSGGLQSRFKRGDRWAPIPWQA
jgi:hypothetical protein